MSTIILENNKGEIFLVPNWTMEHAGFIKNQEGKNVGHTDIKNSTGSTFNQSVVAMDLFNQIIHGKDVQNVENVYQTECSIPVGWSALNTNSEKVITGVVLKQEAPQGSKIASTVLAPAYENIDFGNLTTQTKTLSAIAPKTDNIEFLPDDVKTNEKVLAAMKEGKLRTFVSIFPGPIIINNKSLPKVSEFDTGISFQVYPENNMYIKVNFEPNSILNYIQKYNEKSLFENKPVDIKNDKIKILKDIQELFFHEKRENYLSTFEKNEKINKLSID